MFLGQIIIGLDNLVQIRLHQFKNNINVLEIPSRRWQHDVLDLDYVRMAQQPQKLDFPQDSRCVRDVLKDVVNFLYSDFLTGMGIDCRAHDPITSCSKFNRGYELLLEQLQTCLFPTFFKRYLIKSTPVSPCIIRTDKNGGYYIVFFFQNLVVATKGRVLHCKKVIRYLCQSLLGSCTGSHPHTQ